MTGLGLRVSFGRHVREVDDFGSSSVASRVADLHEAFADPSVHGVLTVIGGFNANQLLRSKMTPDLLRKIVETKQELASVPVACGLDFGHTSPHFTLPIGGRARLDCSGERPRLTLLTH